MPEDKKADDKIKEFADMVDAVERLTKPIQEENKRLHEQIDKIHKDRWRERLIIGILFLAFILLAYLTPDTSYQRQDFEGKSQVQSAGTEVVTHGG